MVLFLHKNKFFHCYFMLGEDLITGGNLFEDTPAVPEIPPETPAPQPTDIPGTYIETNEIIKNLLVWLPFSL